MMTKDESNALKGFENLTVNIRWIAERGYIPFCEAVDLLQKDLLEIQCPGSYLSDRGLRNDGLRAYLAAYPPKPPEAGG